MCSFKLVLRIDIYNFARWRKNENRMTNLNSTEFIEHRLSSFECFLWLTVVYRLFSWQYYRMEKLWCVNKVKLCFWLFSTSYCDLNKRRHILMNQTVSPKIRMDFNKMASFKIYFFKKKVCSYALNSDVTWIFQSF